MDIIYNINDCSFEASSTKELFERIKDYYSIDGVEAEVEMVGDLIHVHIDDAKIEFIEKQFNGILALLSSGDFAKAKPVLEDFLRKYPRHSEGYRCFAQLKMQDGDIEGAIDTNIEALRCNPRNIWALMLMGNIFSKHKKDLQTAESYYNKALEYDPSNGIAINNIGTVFMRNGQYDKAISYFDKALQSDKTYGNAYYGKIHCLVGKGELQKAFDVAVLGSKTAKERPENPGVMSELRRLMVNIAQQLVKDTNYMNVMLGIKDEVEDFCKQEVRLESDDELEVSAKMIYGPTHFARFHQVLYNPSKPYMEHLAIHEFMHLFMAVEASKADKNKVVYGSKQNEENFKTRFAQWIKDLGKRVGTLQAQDMARKLMSGLILQGMNCPLDLFVEQRMYDKYPIVRPLQLLSLLAQEQANHQSIADSEKAKVFPMTIVNASKVMNIVSSLHLKNLFGLEFYQDYKPSKLQLQQAEDLYEEFLAYDGYKPGEEYELVDYFVTSLGLDAFLTLGSEREFLGDRFVENEKAKDIPDVPEETKKEHAEREKAFYEQNKDGEDPIKTMMMSMFMVGALEYFDNKTKDEIKVTAMEIAMEGVKGISPEVKSGYKVNSIPNKDFGGYEFLAYYYVSWALAIPEMLDSLGLPFDTAWKAAKQMWDSKKGK